ncbi:hypothetical protein ACFV1C_18460 [Streptomyces sp. NPDC059605]|uniref:hypothetical protein n=1 Tax=unclassified Streptomyces TaxID=2593676 RepID=UPI0036CA6030
MSSTVVDVTDADFAAKPVDVPGPVHRVRVAQCRVAGATVGPARGGLRQDRHAAPAQAPRRGRDVSVPPGR